MTIQKIKATTLETITSLETTNSQYHALIAQGSFPAPPTPPPQKPTAGTLICAVI